MEDKITLHSDEEIAVTYDPNYKWRAAAGLCTILLTLIAVVLIITISKSQSKESSIFIFGMGVTVAIIVITTLFRYPSEAEQTDLTSKPSFIITLTIISELIASIVSVFVIHSLEK